MTQTSASMMRADIDVGMSIRRSITRGVVAGTGLHEQIATLIAEEIYRALSREFGGGRVWWPLDDYTERDQAIRQQWRDGVCWRDLCARHGLSRSQLYRIVNGVRSGSSA